MIENEFNLSGDEETAVKVGKRHGKPVLYRVNSGKMQQDGFEFYRSANGYWIDDIISHVIKCKKCGQCFSCAVVTYRGSGSFRKGK